MGAKEIVILNILMAIGKMTQDNENLDLSLIANVSSFTLVVNE